MSGKFINVFTHCFL